MKKSWYSTADAARRLGLSNRETLHLIKVGEIKAIWIGGSAADEAKQAVEELFTLLCSPYYIKITGPTES